MPVEGLEHDGGGGSGKEPCQDYNNSVQISLVQTTIFLVPCILYAGAQWFSVGYVWSEHEHFG